MPKWLQKIWHGALSKIGATFVVALGWFFRDWLIAPWEGQVRRVWLVAPWILVAAISGVACWKCRRLRARAVAAEKDRDAAAATVEIAAPQDSPPTPFRHFGVDWNLSSELFRSWETLDVDSSSPNYVASLVNGPFCPTCKKPEGRSVPANKCETCGTEFRIPFYVSFSDTRDNDLMRAKVDTVREAIGRIRAGTLRPAAEAHVGRAIGRADNRARALNLRKQSD